MKMEERCLFVCVRECGGGVLTLQLQRGKEDAQQETHTRTHTTLLYSPQRQVDTIKESPQSEGWGGNEDVLV